MSWCRTIGCVGPVQPLEPGHRVGPHELVLDGDERDRHARHRAHRRAPDPGAEQDALALDHVAAVGLAPRGPVRRRMSNPVTVTPPSNATPAASARRASAVDDPARPCRRRRSGPSSRRGSVEGSSSGERSAHSAGREQLGALDARRNARTPAGASAPPSAPAWSRPRGRRPRTRPARRRGRASS